MNVLGARQVMETGSFETANQYIRFGWKLINQYVVAATEDMPARVTYVLASLRTLEDTRKLITLTDSESVNEHLALGWKLIEKYVTEPARVKRRAQTVHFVLAWQGEEPPAFPGAEESADSADELSLDATAEPEV
jgi:hypothetical protein